MSNVKVGAWAQVHDCSISYTVFHDEVEFEIGGRSGFDLFASEAGLEKLVAAGSQALCEMRAKQEEGRP